MELQTLVHIDRSPWPIQYEDRLLMLGSCFSDNIARKLCEYFFQVTANPFGTLYNPISIANHMTDELLADKDVIIITFGTAWVYIDNQTNQVVDNCQKRPATDFTRYRLTIDDIVAAWRPILDHYADKRFIFTVSPIRHKKDGLHENQISKGILLQAVERLEVPYFPSYEILLDELRDYRFYADDLVHPSSMAIQYIWQRFADTYLYDANTRASMHELHQYWLDTQHRMLHPDTKEAAAFTRHLAEERTALMSRYPWLE